MASLVCGLTCHFQGSAQAGSRTRGSAACRVFILLPNAVLISEVVGALILADLTERGCSFWSLYARLGFKVAVDTYQGGIFSPCT